MYAPSTLSTRRAFLSRAAAAGLAFSGLALATACSATRSPSTRGSRTPLLGFLALTSLADYAPYVDAFHNGLRDIGYVEGQNINTIARFAGGDVKQLPELASELVRLDVDIIVAAATQANQAALNATHTIPIVMTNSGDPVGAGLVKSLAQPGANLTGLTSLNRELAGKRLELLKMTVPGLSRVGVLWNEASLNDFQETQTSAQWLGLSLVSLKVERTSEIPDALDAAHRQGADGLVAISTPLINDQRTTIAQFALEHSLPTISEQRQFVEAGGLIAYGANVLDLYRRAASFVDKILKGASPGDLPVERAQSFELLLNASTARALGLTLPESVLLQTTEVLA